MKAKSGKHKKESIVQACERIAKEAFELATKNGYLKKLDPWKQ